MSVNQLPFEVTYDPFGLDVDITQHIVSIDHCRFQGTGKIRNANIMLDALEGAFVTDPNGGNTPQINSFDQIRIRWQDDNGVEKSGLFEVDAELAQKTEGGTTLPLELKGRERALQDIKTTAYFEFLDPRTVLNILNIFYNDQKGSAQPASTINFLDAGPLQGVRNIYDFTGEFTYYDAMMHVIQRLNQPTSSGGVGNFYSLVVQDNLADDGIAINVKIQGAGATTPTITSSDADPTHSLSYRIDSNLANQVFVRGQANTAAVPGGFHKFNSTIEEINNYPAYVSTANYVTGQRVIEGGVIYEANTAVPISTPPPNASFWDVTTAADILGSVQYSEWTNNKATVTKNSCGNPTGTFALNFDSPCFPDGNLVVRESFFFRDFALIRSIDDTTIASDTVNKFYLRGQAQTGLYRGFRILVDTSLGNPDGSFGDGAGTIFSDRFGRSFENAIVQWTGLEWIVIREPVQPNASDRNLDHCCVLSEGKVYEYNTPPGAGGNMALARRKSDVFNGGNPSGPFAWRDISDFAQGNDVFHYPKNIESVTGLISPEIRANQDISTYLTNSAIKITYEWSISNFLIEIEERISNFFQTAVDTVFDILDNLFTDTVAPTNDEIDEFRATDWYNHGWWYALPFPYPLSEFNGITEDVGDLYGLGTDPNGINNLLFGSLDIQNSTFSHSGLTGFNHAEVQDMGSPFTALAFYFQFNIFFGTTPQPFTGDIPFTVTIYDDLSQVWRTDFNYRHMGDVEEVILPFSSFTVNRPSRNPWNVDTLLINLIHTPELEIRSIFQERRVRLITIQLKSSYDENERYLPLNFDNFITFIAGLNNYTTEGTIDGLRLLKQPFVSSGIQSTRVLNTDTIQATNTRNINQLEAIAAAEQQRKNHKFESYTYSENIRCDLETEQSVFLEDPDLVKFADRNETSPGASDGDPNTRKLVLMSEDFTYNADGKQSGALHYLTLVKRLEVV